MLITVGEFFELKDESYKANAKMVMGDDGTKWKIKSYWHDDSHIDPEYPTSNYYFVVGKGYTATRSKNERIIYLPNRQ